MAALMLSENVWWVILTIAAVAIALTIAAYAGKKRAEGMQKAAAEMGYSYERKGTQLLSELDKNLHLLNQGSGKDASNVLSGPNGQTIFDYQFQSAGGADARTRKSVRQTVAAFRYPSAVFPQFSLGAEHWWHKAASAVGYQMIRFDTHPEFNKRYLLRGDETAVRGFFKPPLLDYFQSLPEKPTWSVEAAGPWLLVYQPSRTVKATELRSFADEAAGVAREVTGRSGTRV